jgi:hypothetical protein
MNDTEVKDCRSHSLLPVGRHRLFFRVFLGEKHLRENTRTTAIGGLSECRTARDIAFDQDAPL